MRRAHDGSEAAAKTRKHGRWGTAPSDDAVLPRRCSTFLYPPHRAPSAAAKPRLVARSTALAGSSDVRASYAAASHRSFPVSIHTSIGFNGRIQMIPVSA
jgi:hypothetical protein